MANPTEATATATAEDHAAMGHTTDPVAAEKARAVILIGEDRNKIADVLEGYVTYLLAQSMEDAVEVAAELAQPGDNVLLSPACASFDMFKGYGHRGDVFSDAVRGLP